MFGPPKMKHFTYGSNALSYIFKYSSKSKTCAYLSQYK